MAYTTIDDPSEYFTITLYTGDGSNGRAITNSANAGNFQPDWLWYKERSSTSSHRIFDSSRGNSKRIEPDTTTQEETDTTNHQSFDSNGFTVGSSGSTNANGDTYVAWQWKANGGTTTTNDASATGVGTIDSVYQANTTAGFSIVTYTGTGSAGTIAHGVGATPHWVLVKNRSTGDRQWYNQHIGNSSASKGQTLSTNGAEQTLSAVFGDTRASSTVFTVGDNNSINDSGDNYVAYVFAPIKGYSKFGSYTGNGNADGAFVYTGFKPAWLMIKRIDSANHWLMFDIKRDINNVGEKWLRADTNDAASTGIYWDGLSNGFKARTNDPIINASGGTYVYMTFAEHPFVSSKGVPVTAR
jgi:hypothetical protein